MHHTLGTFRYRRLTTTTLKNFLIHDFFFLFLSLDESFRIQLQKYSQPTDKLRLEKRELIFMRRFDRLRLRFCLSSLLLTKEGETCVRLTWQPFGTQLGFITLLLKEKKALLAQKVYDSYLCKAKEK